MRKPIMLLLTLLLLSCSTRELTTLYAVTSESGLECEDNSFEELFFTYSLWEAKEFASQISSEYNPTVITFTAAHYEIEPEFYFTRSLTNCKLTLVKVKTIEEADMALHWEDFSRN
jgi:hypothetical protein